MKKIAMAFLLSGMPSFVYAMERSDEISASVLSSIVKNKDLGMIKMRCPSLDRTKIVTLCSLGNICVWDGKTGVLLNRYSVNRRQDVKFIGFDEEDTKIIVKTSKGLREYCISTPESTLAVAIKMLSSRYLKGDRKAKL